MAMNAGLGNPAAAEPEPQPGTPAPPPEPAPEPDSGAAPEPEAGAEGEGEGPPEGEEPEGPEAGEGEEGAGEGEGEGEEELVAVEYEGETYKLPPPLKDALLRQADYTRKTQEVSAQRRELEQTADAHKQREEQFAQHIQQQRQNLKDYARFERIGEEIEELSKTNWDELNEEDPQEAQRRSTRLSVLRGEHNDLVSKLREQEQNAALEAQRSHARRVEDALGKVAQEVPNWGPELANKISETGRRLGYTDRDLHMANGDPRAVKALYLAHLGEQFLKQQRAATRPRKQPAKPVKKASGGGSAPSGPRDDMATKEWLEARNRELAKKRGAAGASP